jgi:hypothetical protein
MRAVSHYHSATTLGTILESTRVVTERREILHGLLRVVTERSERLHGLESPSRMRAVPHYHSATTLGTVVPRVVTERRERLHGLLRVVTERSERLHRLE